MTYILRRSDAFMANIFSFVSQDITIDLDRNKLYSAERTQCNSNKQFILKPIGDSSHDFSIYLGADYVKEVFDFTDSSILKVNYSGEWANTRIVIDDGLVHLDILDSIKG